MRIYLVNAESGKGYRAGLMEADHLWILESFAISDSEQPLAFKPVDPGYFTETSNADLPSGS